MTTLTRLEEHESNRGRLLVDLERVSGKDDPLCVDSCRSDIYQTTRSNKVRHLSRPHASLIITAFSLVRAFAQQHSRRTAPAKSDGRKDRSGRGRTGT